MDKDVLTLPQAAEQCSLRKGDILKHISTGKLIASKNPSGQYSINKQDLINFMHQQGMSHLANYLPEAKKILVVDDESSVLSMLKKMLSKEGYLIEIASTGLEADSKIKKFKPGLVVLDLFIPGIDGFEVCRQIKGNSYTEHIKVIAITGQGNEETERRILKTGADSYLTKPLDRYTLLEKVKILLEKDLKDQD